MHPERIQWLAEMPDEVSDHLIRAKQMNEFMSGELPVESMPREVQEWVRDWWDQKL